MPEKTKGRVDVLVLRLAEELANRIHAKTMIDIRDALCDTAEQLIDDMKIPRVAITANDVVRSLLGVTDRSKKPQRRLRRVV